jgi:hypothetical protein
MKTMIATKLDLILDRVKARQSEVTLDADEYTAEQVNRIVVAAKARGFNVSGTHRWILIRDLREMNLSK